jgi:hypothetical protein
VAQVGHVVHVIDGRGEVEDLLAHSGSLVAGLPARRAAKKYPTG